MGRLRGKKMGKRRSETGGMTARNGAKVRGEGGGEDTGREGQGEGVEEKEMKRGGKGDGTGKGEGRKSWGERTEEKGWGGGGRRSGWGERGEWRESVGREKGWARGRTGQ